MPRVYEFSRNVIAKSCLICNNVDVIERFPRLGNHFLCVNCKLDKCDFKDYHDTE